MLFTDIGNEGGELGSGGYLGICFGHVDLEVLKMKEGVGSEA